MIVTRQRRKPFPYGRLILPIVAIALVAFALWWGPSRNAITGGPMAPAWRTAGNWITTVAAPFHFAAQNQLITDRNRRIAQLQTEVASAQNAAAAKQNKIASLQAQIAQLQTQAASARGGTHGGPQPATGAFGAQNGTPAHAGGAYAAGDLTAGATPDMRRVAAYWASMEPANAAKIVQRLPPAYVARIFALMSPDAAGAILDALPPTLAAKLTQAHPELQH